MSPQQADAERRREQRETARARLAALFDPSRPTNSVEATAAYVGVSRGLGYEQARSGSWPALRCGSRLLILTEPFLAMLASAGREQSA